MLKIGNLEIKYRAMPSPMASFTDIAYRKLLDEIGYTGYMVTEMVSAEGLRRRRKRTFELIKTTDFKTPQLIQIFGSAPDEFVDAAKVIQNETSYQGIDINMGCPAAKVLRKGAGSALLKEPLKVAAIVRALRKSTTLPLTVKIRLGFDSVNVFEIGQILESEGVDAITVHFRLKSDGYQGEAKWQYASLIKEKISTILLGNGNIITAQEAMEKLHLVDGVMIGRGAVKDPFIFAKIAGANAGNRDFTWVIDRLLELIEQFYPEKLQLNRIKAFSRFLFFGKKNCKKVREKVFGSNSYKEAKNYLRTIDLDEYDVGIGHS
jgi:nifR3 family TIM-barrel protein